MVLSAVHKEKDEIPEQYQDLYSERNGQWELTGVAGVKTQADIDRLTVSLTKERDDHKITKEKLRPWSGLGEFDEISGKIDKFAELELAAGGKLDDVKIQELTDKRVEATLQTKISPLNRQIEELTRQRDEVTLGFNVLTQEKVVRTIHDEVRSAMVKAKVIPEAQEDALMLAERMFGIDENGRVTTKDQIGVTPGVAPDLWLTEIREKRPHWWPESQGGGAGGGTGHIGATNPWTKGNWNVTDQVNYYKQHGEAKAVAVAKMAGSSLGAVHPPK